MTKLEVVVSSKPLQGSTPTTAALCTRPKRTPVVRLCLVANSWRAKWEVFVDRTHRSARRALDQWSQESEESVRFAALWIQARRLGEMVHNDEVQEFWNPALEAHPFPAAPSPEAAIPPPRGEPARTVAKQQLLEALRGGRLQARATWASQSALQYQSFDQVVRAVVLRAGVP